MFTIKKTSVSFIISLLLAGTLALFNIAYADNDAGTGGDASISMTTGRGCLISYNESKYFMVIDRGIPGTGQYPLDFDAYTSQDVYGAFITP